MQRDIVRVGGDAFRVCGRNFAGLKIILINLDLMQYSMSLIALASHFSFGWMGIAIFVEKKKKKGKHRSNRVQIIRGKNHREIGSRFEGLRKEDETFRHLNNRFQSPLPSLTSKRVRLYRQMIKF